MKRYIIPIAAMVAIILMFEGCNKSAPLTQRLPHLPQTPYEYASVNVVAPANPYGGNFSNNAPKSNPTTNAGATLGRVLFYEPMLSVNNTISCGSCHKQQLAFSDNTAVSVGFKGQTGTRNALPVFNEFLNSGFFWDGRVNTLESQVFMPVKNHAEMGLESLDNLEKKLQAAPYYASLFQAAFGSSQITARRATDALAQFIRSMQTFNSRFDQGASSNFSNFTNQEREGELAFRTFRCNSCHGGSNLSTGEFFVMGGPLNVANTNDYSNSGLDAVITDPGLQDVTGNLQDMGRVKVPSLRNIALTAPYMHDGRFNSLEEVVEHYNSGIQPNANLDVRLTNAEWGIAPNREPVKMNMSDAQKKALVAFLHTLTDYQFISDPKFSDPFK